MSFAPSIPLTSAMSPTLETASGKHREMSGENITHEWGEQIAAVLRAEHPYATAKLVYRRLRGRISIRTIEKWLDGTSTPSLIHFVIVSREYPQLVGVVFPWLRVVTDGEVYAAHVSKVADRLAREIDDLRSRL